MTINLWKTTITTFWGKDCTPLVETIISTRELSDDDVTILVQDKYPLLGRAAIFDYAASIPCIGIGNHGELLWGEAEG